MRSSSVWRRPGGGRSTYLELRSLIATERHPFRRRLVLLGVDRPQRLVSISAQRSTLPAEWSLIVPSDGARPEKN